MAERKPFLLRIDPKVFESLQRWADDDLRSLKAQIEFLLRKALVTSGRLPEKPDPARPGSDATRSPEPQK